MKTIGLLGGMSWESSAMYYRLINEEVAARLGGLHSVARPNADRARSVTPNASNVAPRLFQTAASPGRSSSVRS